jgi:hypothetical protein
MEAGGEKGKRELKFRCLKKEDKETLQPGIGVQAKGEKCFSNEETRLPDCPTAFLVMELKNLKLRI